MIFDADDMLPVVIGCVIRDGSPQYTRPLVTVCGNVEIGLDDVVIVNALEVYATATGPSAIDTKGTRICQVVHARKVDQGAGTRGVLHVDNSVKEG